MPKVNIRLKNINQTEIKSVKMILLPYLQGFTAGYTNEKITQTQPMFLSFIKETNIFLSSDKKND